MPVQSNLGLWATRDTRPRGRHIKAGDGLIVCLARANADPYMRPTGSTANYAHLSFAHGSH
jgi:cytochrome P450